MAGGREIVIVSVVLISITSYDFIILAHVY